MTDDVQHILGDLKPRRAPADLRGRVLGAVDEELSAAPKPPASRARWDLRLAAAVAVSLVLGVVLNVWSIRQDDARHARLYGPSRLPREIRETVEVVENVAGPECAEFLTRRFVASRQSICREQPSVVFRRHQQMMQFVLTEKGFVHVEEDIPVEHAEEDTQMERNSARWPGRGAFDRQRGICLA